MEQNIPKEDLYLMEILQQLQNPDKLKDAEKVLEAASLEEIIPPFIRIISRRVENPEETAFAKHRFLCQSAAINLKNILHNRYRSKVANYFKKDQQVQELLYKIIEILVK